MTATHHMMHKGQFIVESNRCIARNTFRMRLHGEGGAFSAGGQFAALALEGHFLRRPFAALEWDSEGFDVIYKVVGEGTLEMSRLQKGSVIDALTGLGNGFDPSKCKEKALVVAGGLGSSPLFPLVRALRAEGKEVSLIMGFNTAAELVLTDEYKALGAEITICTMDGSLGRKGLVTEVLEKAAPKFDFFYCCGPKVMMRAVCENIPEGIGGQVSLEERMGCGCGICYGCTCRTKKGPRRICADGPVFDREDVVWE